MGLQRVRNWLRWISDLPWAVIILLDVAAFAAFGFAALLLSMPRHGQHAVKHPSAAIEKRIALSFDDAPRGPGGFLESGIRSQMLLAALKRAGIKQAAFFTNPGRIDKGSGNEAELRAYAKAGHVLANHTATHLILRHVSAERFLADIDEAEGWLKQEKGYRPWFRFPQLDEGGRDKTKRDAVRAGLKARGLRNGYVTADGWDWYMEWLADRAVKSHQKIDYDGLRDLYVETHVGAANFADQLGRRALGRAPAQVLLLHETDLAALYIEDLVAALRADGWTIITADEAYADPLGELPPPVVADASGTLIQMISWDKGVKGPRWYERNELAEANRLFNLQVLHKK